MSYVIMYFDWFVENERLNVCNFASLSLKLNKKISAFETMSTLNVIDNKTFGTRSSQ